MPSITNSEVFSIQFGEIISFAPIPKLSDILLRPRNSLATINTKIKKKTYTNPYSLANPHVVEMDLRAAPVNPSSDPICKFYFRGSLYYQWRDKMWAPISLRINPNNITDDKSMKLKYLLDQYYHKVLNVRIIYEHDTLSNILHKINKQ